MSNTLGFIKHIRNRHLLLLDLVLLTIAVYVTFVLRVERLNLTTLWPAFLLFTAITLITLPLIFRYAGVYSRFWRYASVEELLLLTGTVTLGVFITAGFSYILVYLLPDVISFPRSVPFIFLPLALTVTAGTRFLLRSSYSIHQTQVGSHPRKRMLIVGAGDAGQMLAREINAQQSNFELLGFIDDDPNKHGLTVRGSTIWGGRDLIPELVKDLKIERIVIAIPSASGDEVREIVDLCKTTDAKVRIIPGLTELVSSDASLHQLRPVELSDLLRRDPIKTNLAAVHTLVKDKVVLVTGAGGSIGSEICRQIAKAHPSCLILLGHGENSIYKIHNELRNDFAKGQVSLQSLHPVIADVRDGTRLEQIFCKYKPQVVFHAAAHKHVPLMESNPTDAITNNILGTNQLLQTCLAHDIQHFVLISTDKAVNPANIMGMTKRMAELLVLDAAYRSGQVYVAVRFGNVLGSRGSVVPYFKRQIENGGPVTVTHRDITRYFMTIPEAVQLVLQAATLGTGGDLFMLKMGKPVKIVDLANDLITLSGLTPGKDIKIEFTGLRPGEKLHEELYQGHETSDPTEHEKIVRVTSKYRQPPDLQEAIPHLRCFAEVGDIEKALALIAAIIPEYKPPDGIKPQPLHTLQMTPSEGITTEQAR